MGVKQLLSRLRGKRDMHVSFTDLVARQPERVRWCERCQYEHHPYVPCQAGPNSVCVCCGKTGHFECYDIG